MGKSEIQSPATNSIESPSGLTIISALRTADVHHIICLPDIVTSDGLLWPLSRDPRFTVTRICKEDEGVSICGAMSYNGTRAVLMMQQTGLMDSLNAIRAIGVDYELPVVMLVGLQGKEPHLRPTESSSYGVRIVEPVLKAMELSYSLIEEPGDETHISGAIDEAYRLARPHVFLVGRPPVPG